MLSIEWLQTLPICFLFANSDNNNGDRNDLDNIKMIPMDRIRCLKWACRRSEREKEKERGRERESGERWDISSGPHETSIVKIMKIKNSAKLGRWSTAILTHRIFRIYLVIQFKLCQIEWNKIFLTSFGWFEWYFWVFDIHRQQAHCQQFEYKNATNI